MQLESKQKDNIYFPGLNGLRFFAAFLVVIHHIEQNKLLLKYPNIFFVPFIETIGSLGVTLFFVLSGFLITFLLLTEKTRFNDISVKQFYIRRVLRIWPLYFLIVILGLFILPQFSFFDIPIWSDNVSNNLGLKVFFFFLILPNIAALITFPVPYAAQTWSIGVEEQFYLIWPWIINYSKKYLSVLLFIIVFLFMIRNSVEYFYQEAVNNTTNKTDHKLVKALFHYVDHLRIGCMAIGGIGSYLLFFKKEKQLLLIYHPLVQWFTWLLIILLLYTGYIFPFIHHEFFAILFLIIVINISSNKKSIVTMENTFFNFLGKISYGLYMYHNIAIVICIKLLAGKAGLKFETIYSNAILYVLSFALTIAMAWLSFNYFEKVFLKFKHLFTKVKSGS